MQKLDAFIEAEKTKAVAARPDMNGKTKAERLADIHANRRQAAEAEKASSRPGPAACTKEEINTRPARKPSMIQSMLRRQLDEKLGKEPQE